eukprot:m.84432 g.84432  ORF g.84432 m.84432 type:complete len:507 (-) comp25751_c0_seq1:67-1587(-)
MMDDDPMNVDLNVPFNYSFPPTMDPYNHHQQQTPFRMHPSLLGVGSPNLFHQEDYLDMNTPEPGATPQTASSSGLTLVEEKPYVRPVVSTHDFNVLQKNLLEAHQKLLAKDENDFFMHPVTDDIAPSYSKTIKQPMCFGDIGKKLKQKRYRSVDDYEKDFELIATNCMTYNGPNTDYYKAAKKLLTGGSTAKSSVLNKCRKSIARTFKNSDKADKVERHKKSKEASDRAKRKKLLDNGGLPTMASSKRQRKASVEEDEGGCLIPAAEILAHARNMCKDVRRKIEKEKVGEYGCIKIMEKKKVEFRPLSSGGTNWEGVATMKCSDACGLFDGPPPHLRSATRLVDSTPCYNYEAPELHVSFKKFEQRTKSAMDPIYFDSELRGYCESLHKFCENIGDDAPVVKNVRTLINHLTLDNLTKHPEELHWSPPKTPPKPKPIVFGKDIRDRQLYFEIMAGTLKVIRYLNERLEQRLATKVLKIEKDEVETAGKLVQTLIDLGNIRKSHAAP